MGEDENISGSDESPSEDDLSNNIISKVVPGTLNREINRNK